jgi:hypothetical protein
MGELRTSTKDNIDDQIWAFAQMTQFRASCRNACGTIIIFLQVPKRLCFGAIQIGSQTTILGSLSFDRPWTT